MILLQACPDTTYFHWQLWVQMINFRRFGLEDKAVICLAYKDQPSAEGLKFARWTRARVEFFKDERQPTPYASSVRPHVIKKLFEKESFPCVFYHDSDIIFLERPDLEGMAAGDVNYVGATAKNYLDYGYLSRFPRYIMHGLWDICGVTEDQVRANDHSCGGAQSVYKGTDYAFWEACEWKMDAVYRWFEECCNHGLTKFGHRTQPPSYNVQKWCADMWVPYYELLIRNAKIEHHPHLNFGWPYTDSRESVKSYYIAHNAGITEENKWRVDKDKDGNVIRKVHHLFYKGEYNTRMPWGGNFDYVKPDTMSYLYVQHIKEAELHYKAFTEFEQRNQKAYA